MSPLSRVGQTSLRAVRRQTAGQVRTLYTTRGHVAHTNFPFSYANKKTFGIKILASLSVAFFIPFGYSAYMLRKSGGGSN